MLKFFISIALIAAAITLFFTKTQTQFDVSKDLGVKKDAYNEALANAKKIKETTNKLLDKYNSISPEDVGKMNVMLPSRFDSIKMAVEIENLLNKNGMSLTNISFKESGGREKGKVAPKTKVKKKEALYETAGVSFRVKGRYDDFLSFLGDMERNLRLVDVNSIKFSPGMSEIYEFDLDAATYWLKNSL